MQMQFKRRKQKKSKFRFLILFRSVDKCENMNTRSFQHTQFNCLFKKRGKKKHRKNDWLSGFVEYAYY